MNCEEFLTVAADLARNQSRGPQRGILPGVVVVDASERARAQGHVIQCYDCRRVWNDQLELSERFRKVADHMTSARAPEDVETRLLVAFRDRTRFVPIHSAQKRWRWVTAAAAVVLMVFGIVAWRLRVASVRPPRQASSESGTAPRSQQPKPEQSHTVAVAVTGTRSSIQRLKPTLRRSVSRLRPASSQLTKSVSAKPATVEHPSVPASNAETKELATEFVLVGYGNALDLQDGGQLVRVELPRSALAKFGLPMNMDRADEGIKADVLVGTDGLARALRFVEVKAIKQ